MCLPSSVLALYAAICEIADRGNVIVKVAMRKKKKKKKNYRMVANYELAKFHYIHFRPYVITLCD
jgi:hypothetical protein